MRRYRVTLGHDDGTVVLETVARDAETARMIVCYAEGAPARSVLSVDTLD